MSWRVIVDKQEATFWTGDNTREIIVRVIEYINLGTYDTWLLPQKEAEHNDLHQKAQLENAEPYVVTNKAMGIDQWDATLAHS